MSLSYLKAVLSLGGAVLSSRSARKAGDAARRGAERSAAAIQAAAEQARTDVLDLFPKSETQLLGGASKAFDILSQGIGSQQQALSQGNLNAQRTVGGGFDQQRAALLGLPINTQNFSPKGIDFTQAPENPFFVPGQDPLGAIGSSGLIGAQTGFQTGQGVVTGSTGARGIGNIGAAIAGTRPHVLNDFATQLDSLGKLIRLPDGSTKFDPTGSQVPGSAAIISDNPDFRELQQLRSLQPERRTAAQTARLKELEQQ